MTRAWKFLDERSQGIFSGFAWPRPPAAGSPGAWVESDGVIPCAEGIHACSAEQLAWWMSAQLWEIELGEPVIESGPKLVAQRGRLVRLVDDWPALGTELAERAVWRVRGHAVDVLTAAGATRAAAGLAAAVTFEELLSSAETLDFDSKSATGIAIEQIIDSVGDTSNPIFACWDAARAAGHAASAVDRSISTYQRAFALERARQSEWIAARLRLTS